MKGVLITSRSGNDGALLGVVGGGATQRAGVLAFATWVLVTTRGPVPRETVTSAGFTNPSAGRLVSEDKAGRAVGVCGGFAGTGHV